MHIKSTEQKIIVMLKGKKNYNVLIIINENIINKTNDNKTLLRIGKDSSIEEFISLYNK